MSSEKAWLSDEIMHRAQENFPKVGKTKDLFPTIDDPVVQLKIVVISPAHVLHHAVLRFLVPDKAAPKRPGRKNTLRKMNKDQAAMIGGSTLHVNKDTNIHQKSFGLTRIFFKSRMLGFSV